MTDSPNDSTALLPDTVGSSILVVDDDADLSLALSRLLRAAGFRVTTFPSAEALLAADLAARPACMVLDIHLSGMSGLDLGRELAARGWQVPIVFVTAHDNPLTRERVQRAGATAYLPKPFEGEALIAAIERIVKRDGPAAGGPAGSDSRS